MTDAVQTVLKRMQNQWNRPFRATDEACTERLRNLGARLKPYDRDQMEAAFDKLVETHKGTWPETTDWLKALRETRKPKQADKGRENPFEARRTEARRIFAEHYSDTELAFEAKENGWWTDYRLIGERLVWLSLKDHGDPFSITFGTSWLDAMRANAERYRLAAIYHQSPEYQAVHGKPLLGWAGVKTVDRVARETHETPEQERAG